LGLRLLPTLLHTGDVNGGWTRVVLFGSTPRRRRNWLSRAQYPTAAGRRDIVHFLNIIALFLVFSSLAGWNFVKTRLETVSSLYLQANIGTFF